jgi:hypothetical protein
MLLSRIQSNFTNTLSDFYYNRNFIEFRHNFIFVTYHRTIMACLDGSMLPVS